MSFEKGNSLRNPMKNKDGLRQCCTCKEYKGLNCYGISRNSKKDTEYYRAECKSCCVDRSRSYIANNYSAVQKQKRNSALKYSYQITSEDYDKILAEQNGGCAICGVDQANLTGRYKSLAVDHDHDTNKVRGLLCNKCNRAIGMFGDQVELLQSAINYLAYHKKVD